VATRFHSLYPLLQKQFPLAVVSGQTEWRGRSIELLTCSPELPRRARLAFAEPTSSSRARGEPHIAAREQRQARVDQQLLGAFDEHIARLLGQAAAVGI